MNLIRIISWDIGSKNLAYCIIDIDSNLKNWKIKKWNVFSLMDKHKSDSILIGKCVYEKFCKIKSDIVDGIDIVLIESQSNIRSGMEAISSAITVFYRCSGIDIINSINPKDKYRVFPNVDFPKGKSGYYQRKKKISKYTEKMLEKLKLYNELKYLKTHNGKIDDLCDAFVLALSFIEYKFISDNI